jgi:hypothetical protein
MQVHLHECQAAKLDPKKVAALAKKLSVCGLEAQHMGLTVFGSGEGRLQQLRGAHPLIVATLDGCFDGGAFDPSRDGPDDLMRGE